MSAYLGTSRLIVAYLSGISNCVVRVCIFMCMHVCAHACIFVYFHTEWYMTAGVLQNIINKNSFMLTIQLHLKLYMPLSAETRNSDLMLY